MTALWPLPRPISRKTSRRSPFQYWLCIAKTTRSYAVRKAAQERNLENLQGLPARHAHYGSGHDQFRPVGVFQALSQKYRWSSLAFPLRALSETPCFACPSEDHRHFEASVNGVNDVALLTRWAMANALDQELGPEDPADIPKPEPKVSNRKSDWDGCEGREPAWGYRASASRVGIDSSTEACHIGSWANP
jgi:hypothetical protein